MNEFTPSNTLAWQVLNATVVDGTLRDVYRMVNCSELFGNVSNTSFSSDSNVSTYNITSNSSNASEPICWVLEEGSTVNASANTSNTSFVSTLASLLEGGCIAAGNCTIFGPN